MERPVKTLLLACVESRCLPRRSDHHMAEIGHVEPDDVEIWLTAILVKITPNWSN